MEVEIIFDNLESLESYRQQPMDVEVPPGYTFDGEAEVTPHPFYKQAWILRQKFKTLGEQALIPDNDSIPMV